MLSDIYDTTFITLPFNSGVEDVAVDTGRMPVAYYDLLGRHLDCPQDGINVVEFDDGTYEKVFLP